MECPHVPLISMKEFGERLSEKVVRQRIPIEGSIELTARCNLQCAHCYINLPAGDRQARKNELNTGEWYQILDQIADAGCLYLLLTGGEPLIRPDFLDIYTYAKKKGLLITLFTNGTMLTPHIANYLAEWRPYMMEITLYGYSQATYERITGVRGSYGRCIQGVNLLLQRQIPLRLKTMVLTLNRHELEEMQAFADNLGVKFRYDPIVNMRLDGGHQPSEMRLSAAEVVELELADTKQIKRWGELAEKFYGPPLRPDDLYYCGAGMNNFHIDSYAQLTSCMMVRHPSYDLREGTFHDGWHNFMVQFRAQKRSRATACQTCELIASCGNCPGVAQVETGDEEAVVEYLCEIAHLKARALRLGKSRIGDENGQPY